MFGPAGAGKSRLGHELTARLGDERDRRRGALPPVRRGDHVLADRVGPHGRRRDRRARPARGVAAQDLRAPAAPTATPRSSPSGSCRSSASTPGAAAIQETFWGVRKLFEHLGSQRPLVAVFDDIQWGEPTFLDLLEYLADWLRGAPVLLLCLARPELLDVRPEWVTPKANAELVTLTPLTAHETDGLIQGLLEGDELEPEARVRITRDGRGQPAVRRADAADARRRRGARASRRAVDGDAGPVAHHDPADDQRAAHRAPRASRRRRARGHRARVDRRARVLVGRGRRDLRRRGAPARHLAPAVAHPQGADPPRLLRERPRGVVPLRPHPHPRRRLPRHPEGRARRAPRAARGLARGRGARHGGRVRGDPRLPRRAGAAAAARGRAARAAGRGARPARRLDPGRRRAAGVRPRRHAGRREPALARRRGHARADPRARRAPRPARVRPARHRRPRAPRGRGRRDDPHRGRQPHPRARAVRRDHGALADPVLEPGGLGRGGRQEGDGGDRRVRGGRRRARAREGVGAPRPPAHRARGVPLGRGRLDARRGARAPVRRPPRRAREPVVGAARRLGRADARRRGPAALRGRPRAGATATRS